MKQKVDSDKLTQAPLRRGEIRKVITKSRLREERENNDYRELLLTSMSVK